MRCSDGNDTEAHPCRCNTISAILCYVMYNLCFYHSLQSSPLSAGHVASHPMFALTRISLPALHRESFSSPTELDLSIKRS